MPGCQKEQQQRMPVLLCSAPLRSALLHSALLWLPLLLSSLSHLGFSALLQWMLSAVRSPNWSRWRRPARLTLSFLTPLWFLILVPVPKPSTAHHLDKCERKKVSGRRRRRIELLKSEIQHLHTSVCMFCCLRARENLVLFDSS